MNLVFLCSSDIHGYIMPTDYQNSQDYHAPFGLARVSSVIKAERAKYGKENVVVVDAGDSLQGSPLASFTHTVKDYSALKNYTDFYNKIGYDARCVGNHDFNYGLDYLKYYIDHNQAPFLNANVLDEQTGRPAFGKAYQIFVKNGVKVGILGITTQHIPYWEPKEHVLNLKFVSAFEQIKHYARILRPQVDVLAVVYHGGFESNPETGLRTEPNTGENEGYRILKEIPEIDVFLTGHQHRKISLVTRQTAIVQPGYRGEAVGEVLLKIDKKSQKIISRKTRLIATEDFEPDSKLVSLGSELNASAQKWLDRPIAHLDEPAPIGDANQARLKGAPFINLLQQMQLYFTKADVSATAVMSETAKGFSQNVTMRDILLNYPYSNQLCSVKVTGKELQAIIEYSLAFLIKDQHGKIVFAPKWRDLLFNYDVFYPLQYDADIARPAGQRLTTLKLNGQTIEDGKVYHLAVNNYRAMGGGFYPAYSTDKIEMTLDKDYIQMFQEFLCEKQPKVDLRQNYHFY